MANRFTTPFLLVGNLLFSPQLVEPSEPFSKPSPKLAIGLVAGMIGLGIHVAWISPADFIGFGWRFEYALLVNKVVAFAIGICLACLLQVFECAFLSIFKFRGMSRAVQGSTCVFLLVPFVSIPLHEMFPNGVTNSGHVELFWILAVLFICWHVAILCTLLGKGHFANILNVIMSRRRMLLLSLVIAGSEIALTIVILLLVPGAFKLTTVKFFQEWI